MGAALLWAACCLPAPTSAQSAVPGGSASTPPADDASVARRDLLSQAAILADPQGTPAAREEAARRLAGRNAPEAVQALTSVLFDNNAAGQLAVARALADVTQPDPAFIQPLLATYQGPSRPVIEAATRALVNYKGDPAVLASLIAIGEGRQRRPDVRVVAIRGLGYLVEKRSAEVLVGLNASREEGVVVRNAAADALSVMTGVTEFGQDPQRWTRWWQGQAGKGEADFRADLLARKAAAFDRLRGRFQQLTGEMGTILRDQYATLPPAQREGVLLRYLRSGEPEIRVIGAEIVVDDLRNLRDVPNPVREQLRALIGDSSPTVRQAAIVAVTSLNDPTYLDALLIQLAQEQEPAVKSAIARALAPIGNLRAVPYLMKLLDDPSNAVARDAARSLGSQDLNQRIFQADPNLARDLARKLGEVLDGRTGNDKPNTQELRDAIVGTLIYLKQDDILLQLVAKGILLPNRESVSIRVSMLRALGQLGNARVGTIIVSAFVDPDPPVRLAAIDALAITPGAADYSESLRARLGVDETSEDVRNAAWRVLASVFPSLSVEKLSDWSDYLKNDPQRQITVLKVQIDKYLQSKDEDSLAVSQTQIADALAATGDPGAAATYYLQALTIKKSKNAPPIVVISLIDKRLRALLAAKDYGDAASFAGQMLLESPGLQSTVGPLLLEHTNRLLSSKTPADWEDAQKLVDAAASIKPPLAERYLQPLQGYQAELNRKRGVPPATTQSGR